MNEQLPPIVFKQPFNRTDFDKPKGKQIIVDILEAAETKLRDSDLYQMAGVMEEEEVHPDVLAMLDLIAKQFSV